MLCEYALLVRWLRAALLEWYVLLMFILSNPTKLTNIEQQTTHIHLVLRSRMVELYFHSHTRLHDVVFN
jgi:hypothetical protein